MNRAPISAATRAAVRERSGDRCEDCGRPATDMHHRTYTTVSVAVPKDVLFDALRDCMTIQWEAT